MSKKNQITLATASVVIAIPFLGLTSCDSGEVNTEGVGSFELGDRFDEEELTLNSTATAEVPRFFLEGDSFTFDIDFADIDPAVEEYGRGFTAADDPIVIDGSGQFSNAEGQSVTDNVLYLYDGSEFNIAIQNSFVASATNDDAIRDEFEEFTANFSDLGEDFGSTLINLLEDFNVSQAASETYVAVIETGGFIGSANGALSISNNFFAANGILAPTQATVRLDRVISFVPTSTNADLLATNQISGNVIITDTYSTISIANPGDNDLNFLTLEPEATLEFISFDGFNNFFDLDNQFEGINQSIIAHDGTFTLTLSSDVF